MNRTILWAALAALWLAACVVPTPAPTPTASPDPTLPVVTVYRKAT